MNKAPRSNRSQLYTVRLWLEKVDDESWEWRGMVKYVTTGEERYFRDWSVLRHFMLDMLPGSVKILNNDMISD